MIIFSKVATSIQTVLNQKANDIAKETKLITRQRKITGANFAKTLVFGWLQNHTPTVEGLARAGFSQNLKISAQGLDKRFTDKACEFMKNLLEAAVREVIVPEEKIKIRYFSKV
jgi:histone H3/H4